MFYLRYVRSELIRRRARTILTLAGLAVGVAQRSLQMQDGRLLEPLAIAG